VVDYLHKKLVWITGEIAFFATAKPIQDEPLSLPSTCGYFVGLSKAFFGIVGLIFSIVSSATPT